MLIAKGTVEWRAVTLREVAGKDVRVSRHALHDQFWARIGNDKCDGGPASVPLLPLLLPLLLLRARTAGTGSGLDRADGQAGPGNDALLGAVETDAERLKRQQRQPKRS